MGKRQQKIARICKPLSSYEIIDLADNLSLSKSTDEEYLMYVIEFRKSIREEFISNKINKHPDIEISRIQDGFHIMTRDLGLLAYYPNGDRLNVMKQKIWIKTSGIEFLQKNVF